MAPYMNDAAACDRRADDCTKAFIKERLAFFCQHQILPGAQERRVGCLAAYKRLLEDVAAAAGPGVAMDADKWTAACRAFSAAHEGQCRAIRPESLRNALKSFFGAQWEHGMKRKPHPPPAVAQQRRQPVAARGEQDVGAFLRAALRDFAATHLLPGSDAEHAACAAAYRAMLEEAVHEHNRGSAFDRRRPAAPLDAAKYGAKCRDFSLAFAAACRWVCPTQFREVLARHAGVQWASVPPNADAETHALLHCPTPPYVEAPCQVCCAPAHAPLLTPVPEVHGSAADVQLGVAELLLVFFRRVLKVGGRVPPASTACARTDAGRCAFTRLAVAAAAEKATGRPLSAPKWTRRMYYFSETHADVCNFVCPGALRAQFTQALGLPWLNEESVLRCPGCPTGGGDGGACCSHGAAVDDSRDSALASRKRVAEALRDSLVARFFEHELLLPAWRGYDGASAAVATCRADFRRLVWGALEDWATFGESVAFPTEQWGEFYEAHGKVCEPAWATASEFERYVNYRLYVNARRAAQEADRPLPPLETLRAAPAPAPTLAALFEDGAVWARSASAASEDDPLSCLPSWGSVNGGSVGRASSARATPVPALVCDTIDAAVWAEPERSDTPPAAVPPPPPAEVDTLIGFAFATEVLRAECTARRGVGALAVFEDRFVAFVKESLEAWMRAAQTLHAAAQGRALTAMAERCAAVCRPYAAVCQDAWQTAAPLVDLLVKLRSVWWAGYRHERFADIPGALAGPALTTLELAAGALFAQRVLSLPARDQRATFAVATCESHYRQLMWDAAAQGAEGHAFDAAAWEARWQQFVAMHRGVCDAGVCGFDEVRALLDTHLGVAWAAPARATQTPPQSPRGSGLNIDAAPFVAARRIPTPVQDDDAAEHTETTSSCSSSVSDTADQRSPLWAPAAAPRPAMERKISTPPASPLQLPASPPRDAERDEAPLLSTTEEESPGPSSTYSKSPPGSARNGMNMTAWFHLRNSKLSLGALKYTDDDTSSGTGGTFTHRSLPGVSTHRSMDASDAGCSPRVSDPWLLCHRRRVLPSVATEEAPSLAPQTHRSWEGASPRTEEEGSPRRVPPLDLSFPDAQAPRTGFEDDTASQVTHRSLHDDREGAAAPAETEAEAAVAKKKAPAVCSPPPCAHNDWTELRCKRGRRQVRCAVCGSGWRMPAEIPTCSDYWATGVCPRGDACTQHHIRPRRRAKEAAAAAAAAAAEKGKEKEAAAAAVVERAATPTAHLLKPTPMRVSPRSFGGDDAASGDSPRTSLSASLTAPSRSSAFAPLLSSPSAAPVEEPSADAHKCAFRSILEDAIADIKTGAPLCAVKYAWSCFKFSRRFPQRWVDPVRFRERLIVQLGARWINEPSVPECLLTAPPTPRAPTMESPAAASPSPPARETESDPSCSAFDSAADSRPPSHCDSPDVRRVAGPKPAVQPVPPPVEALAMKKGLQGKKRRKRRQPRAVRV